MANHTTIKGTEKPEVNKKHSFARKSNKQLLKEYRELMKVLEQAQEEIEERRRITRVKPETLQLIVNI